MKAALISISFVCAALATPLRVFDVQTPIVDHLQPGFNLDLSVPRLVQFEGQEPVWITELDKIEAKARGIKFFDMPLMSMEYFTVVTEVAYPSSPNATEIIRPIIKTLSAENMEKNLWKFTSFRTRPSQQWLLNRLAEVTAEYASDELREVISISEFPHSWGQNSIVVRIPGSSKELDSVVIIGAHQDSTNMWPWLPAPGKDDGSGSVTIFEAYRAIIAADYRPLRTVEFHWYSAEERGLLGSQAVAHDYAQRSVRVFAMSQFDMTAWVKRGTREEVGVITDFTDPNLTALNKKLVETYLDIPFAETKCGYACSDHASWQKAGYPAIFTIESTFENSNHFIHSAKDRIDISDEFKFTHMLEFSKLAVALAVELGSHRG
ncbi:hypothetical protein M378DRAFT_185173 [Amanita muscaria Koide BX008]|uniref:Peptide hydrolase n=1 Tax=Amanita muscaria (strain Koide BX008) TaxID=946122 RepID=A0A0C2XFB6_AMAMK|nr:hypothetical protein M378DRAFT_185173 [Amanita muscaria Koide BX008]